MKFQGQHILSIDQLERESVERIIQVADDMTPYATRVKCCTVLDGAILANLFFEPSTRTRISFGTAFNLLGGHVRETVGMTTSSLSKGESLYDTARVTANYADAIAMRHPDVGSVAEFARGSNVPVINGGDGPNEHPTQALLDLYTIYNELETLGKDKGTIKIAMIGDLKNGRTVHSLTRLLCLFPNIQFTFISPQALAMPDKILDACENAGLSYNISEDFHYGLKGQDVIYLTRVQEERFTTQEEANLYRGKYCLNQKLYEQHCDKNTIIMHPLPRDSRPEANELSDDMNNNPNLAIFRQTHYGVKVRMALFALVLGVEDKLTQFEKPMNWYSPRHQS
ncbi:aspartate carbamoyltransferase [Kangiella spongicola]|uniref:Aspartate carbamoyltransferase n=1 Tax=Kangiella spongicola TaxID=796379 RepID=A0A318DEP6_9GAMM|nr:aspartate carbamoyltransferase [Kangiella spongicola]PXF64599.1 aspartate carbamoyltransferase [Kangiella spongicola]